MRTVNRTDDVTLPSLTPVWRSCEFQEREIYDLYGIVYTGHPDLRRILMWDEFKDHPMRKDYVPPDDYEWEPTPHADVLDRAKKHYPAPAAPSTPAASSTPAAPTASAASAPTAHSAPAALPAPAASDAPSTLALTPATSPAPAAPPAPLPATLATPPTPLSAAPTPLPSATTPATIRAVQDAFHGDLLEISLGPHHPSTHGVFRMNATLDGEIITALKPVFGYLHRNHEKLGETNTYLANIPYTDRLDYLASLTNNWAYVHAVEKLAGITPTERCEYLRVILGELGRIINHVCLVGFLLNDLGTSFTPLLYSLRERERMLDLLEELTGARMMYNFMRFGGLRADVPDGWLARLKTYLENLFARYMDEQDALLTGNEILLARTQGAGILRPALAIAAGITGPGLRASGVDYDIRKVDKYSIYDRFDFRVPLGEHGDTYDRYMMRMLEMRESVKIILQAMRDLPGGPVNDPKAKSRGLRPKAGEAYARIECPKGELGFHLISDGTPNPCRYRVRPPSFINLTTLEDMCVGGTLADAVITLGSIDIVLGEVDR
jgi:NADH:ubiquinone oxidoreductase subunit D